MLMVYISFFFIIYPIPTHEINPGTTNFSDCCVMIELVNTEVRSPTWKKDFCVRSSGSIWAVSVVYIKQLFLNFWFLQPVPCLI